MKQEKLTKTFMMISNLKKNFDLLSSVGTKICPVVRVNIIVESFIVYHSFSIYLKLEIASTIPPVIELKIETNNSGAQRLKYF